MPAQPTTLTTPENQFGLLPNAAQMMNSYVPLPPPSGIAGFTPLQQTSWQTAQNAAMAGLPASGRAMGLANQYGTGFQDYLSQSGGLNPYTMAMIEQGNALLGRNFAQSVLPTIRQGAQGAGQFGSTRHGIAEGIARQGLGDAMQRQTTDILNNAWNQGQLNQRNAWNMAPNMARMQMGAQYLPAEALSGLAGVQGQIGGQQQALNQMRLGEQRQDFMNLRQEPWDRLSWYGNLVGGLSGIGNTSITPNPNQQNPLLTGLGTGMLGYQLFNQPAVSNWLGGLFGGGGGGMNSADAYMGGLTIPGAIGG